jgi:uncharacterized protein (DUF488 family)
VDDERTLGHHAPSRCSTRPPMRTLYTLGHSKRSADEVIAILRAHAITRLLDIRRFPRSRTNPQFNADVLPLTLARAEISYGQIAALGGRRGGRRASDSPNGGWQVQAFRNYADYADSAAFQVGLSDLLAQAARETCAMMCSEALWWRCHRRIVADYALAQGVPVVHLLSETAQQPAVLTPFAVVGAEHRITYPPPASSSGAPP